MAGREEVIRCRTHRRDRHFWVVITPPQADQRDADPVRNPVSVHGDVPSSERVSEGVNLLPRHLDSVIGLRLRQRAGSARIKGVGDFPEQRRDLLALDEYRPVRRR